MATWRNILDRPRSRRVLLITILPMAPSRLDASIPAIQGHLALQPGAATFSTDADAHVTDSRTGRTIHFSNWIQGYPVHERKWSPQDRRAAITDMDITIMADADVTSALSDAGGGQVGYGSVHLWSDRIALEDTIKLVEGPIRAPAKSDRRGGPMVITISDGDPERSLDYPPGPLTALDFSLASESIVEITMRQTILGSMPQRVFVVPIDQDGHRYVSGKARFYLCDDAMDEHPNSVQSTGVEVATGWRFGTTYTTGPQAFEYTYLEIDLPFTGNLNNITCSGGSGVTDPDPITYLLQTVDKYVISPSAKQALRQLRQDFNFSVFANKSAKALDIAKNLVAQTRFASTFRHNQFELIDMLAANSEIRLGLGTGLLFRLPQQEQETSIDRVVNSLEIQVSRDQYGSTSTTNAPLHRVYRNSNARPGQSEAIRQLCAASEQKYGRRSLILPAADLYAEVDKNGLITGSPSAERYADAVIILGAMTHKPHAYAVDPAIFDQLDWNDRVLLTHPEEKLLDTPTRVVTLRREGAIPTVTFQTEDAGTAVF